MDPVEYLARFIDTTSRFFGYLSREDKIHAAVVRYVKKTYPDVIMIHCPNEGKKSPFERYKYSIMGALTGVSDFIFLEPKYVFKRDLSLELYRELIHHALVIELKAPTEKVLVDDATNKIKRIQGGKLSDAQKDFLKKCNEKKYLGVCCVGFDDAIETINNYMQKPKMI